MRYSFRFCVATSFILEQILKKCDYIFVGIGFSSRLLSNMLMFQDLGIVDKDIKMLKH